MNESDKMYQDLLAAQKTSQADLEQAKKDAMLNQLAANLGAAGSQIGAGFVTMGGRKLYQPDVSGFQNLANQAGAGFEREQGLQKSKLDQLTNSLNMYRQLKQDAQNRALFGGQMAAQKMALEKGQMELDQLRQLQKADTPEAALAQAVIADKFKNELATAGVTPEQIKQMSPAQVERMKGILKMGQYGELTPYQLFGMQQRQAEESRRVGEHEAKRIEKGIDKITTKTEKSQILPMAQALNAIDEVFKKKGGSVDKPPKGDIPGLGVFDTLKPDFMSSADDVTVRQNMQTLANMVLKTRSGSAVTDPEFKRFLQEASVGKFSREQDSTRFIKKMRDLVYMEAKNIEAGVPEQALQEYADTFGAKPTELVPGKVPEIKGKKASETQVSDMVRVQLPNGQVGSIPRSKLEEAKKRGAKEL